MLDHKRDKPVEQAVVTHKIKIDHWDQGPSLARKLRHLGLYREHMLYTAFPEKHLEFVCTHGTPRRQTHEGTEPSQGVFCLARWEFLDRDGEEFDSTYLDDFISVEGKGFLAVFDGGKMKNEVFGSAGEPESGGRKWYVPREGESLKSALLAIVIIENFGGEE